MATHVLASPIEALDFDDLSQWVVRRGVPIFDEHTETDEHGNVVRSFGREKLQEICDACNRRESETGDVTPLLVGHTDPTKTEDNQPDTVGYARTYRVGTFGPKNKLAALADFFFRKAAYPRLLTKDGSFKYQRRSVEYWDDDKIFDPICLLVRTPKRDLGMLSYAKDARKHGHEVYVRDSEDGEPPMTPEQTPPAAAQATPPAAAATPPADDALPPEHQQMAERYAKHLLGSHPAFQHLQKMYMAECGGATPQRYEAAAPGAAAGGNTFTPGDTKTNAPAEMPKPGESEPERMQREQRAIIYARQETRILELEKRLADSDADKQRSANETRHTRREAALKQLVHEGFEFDLAEQFGRVKDMDDASFVREEANMRKHYRQAPVAGVVGAVRVAETPVKPTPTANGRKALTKDVVAKALQYMREKKVEPDKYDEVLQKFAAEAESGAAA